MRTANYLLPIALWLLMAATAHGQVSIVPPARPLEAGRHYLLRVNGLTLSDLARATVIAAPSESVTVDTTSLDSEPLICFKSSARGRCFVAIAIIKGQGPPLVAGIMLDVGGNAPPPPPPDDETLAEKVATWLETVPLEARDEPIENPLTGETMTRQQAVGATFITIGEVAGKLGAIRAVNVMLMTGMGASFGDRLDEWETFAEAVDKALGELKESGATAAEYGAALQSIGEVLK